MKTKIKLSANIGLWVALIAVSVFSLASIAVAANGGFSWDKVEAKVAALLAGQISAPAEEPEEELGALNSMSVINCVGDFCEASISVSWTDASTTLVAIADPFETATSSVTPETPLLRGDTVSGLVGATSTIEEALVIFKGVTTSWNLDCGPSNSRWATSTLLIKSEGAIGTSTAGIIAMGISSTTNAGVGSYVAEVNGGVAVAPVRKGVFTPQKPYFVCKVYQTYGTELDTFTDSVNSADGKVLLRVVRPRF